MSDKKTDNGETTPLAGDDNPKNCCCPCFPSTCFCRRRLGVCSLCCGGMIIIHAMRVNIAITVVTILDDNPHEKVSINAAKTLPDVSWSASMIGLLHAIFYVGFLITQIPGGYLATKIPANRIFGLSILFSCALNLLLPTTIANVGFVLTCLVRLLQGLCEGVSIPAMYKIIHQWSPQKEKNRFAAISLTGMYAGAIIGFPLDGAITHYLNWQYVFYIHAISGFIWFILWFAFVFEKPEFDNCITQEEKDYILEGRDKEISIDKIPWKDIFSSVPFWGVIVCHFVRSWMFFFLLTNEPAYLNNFKFTILENGFFSAAPHVIKVLTSLTGGLLADIIYNKWQISLTILRKIFTCTGFFIEAAACYALSGVSEGYWAVAFLCFGVGMSGLTVAGWQVNHLDLAPQYASVMVGISATFGTVGGILSPIVIGVMTHYQTLWNWQKSFILTGSLLAGGATVYLFIGSGERQPWSYHKILTEPVTDGKIQAEDITMELKPTESKSYNTAESTTPVTESPQKE